MEKYRRRLIKRALPLPTTVRFRLPKVILHHAPCCTVRLADNNVPKADVLSLLRPSDAAPNAYQQANPDMRQRMDQVGRRSRRSRSAVDSCGKRSDRDVVLAYPAPRVRVRVRSMLAKALGRVMAIVQQ